MALKKEKNQSCMKINAEGEKWLLQTVVTLEIPRKGTTETASGFFQKNILFLNSNSPCFFKKITRGNYIIYSNQPFFFIAEACRPNSLIVQCFMVAQTMIECTYSLISSCRWSVHSALIITNVAGSKHELRVAGFQRNESREIMLSSLAIFYWSS